MKIEIKNGHTNKSYREDNLFVQYKNKNGLNHLTDYRVLEKFNFVPKLISDTNDEIKWEWIENSEELWNPSDEDLKKIAHILLELHNSKVEFAPFILKKRINEYRKIYNKKNQKIDVIEKSYRKINLILKNMYKTTPVHGDIWQSNVLKSNNNIFLVDWEYSHMGDHHFELAYIIESYNMTEHQQKVFLEAYDDYNPKLLNKHKALVHYLTILWLCTYDKPPFSDQSSIQKLEKLLEQGI